MASNVSRRGFLAAAAAGGAAGAAAGEKPALLGGKKVRTQGWPGWPVFDKSEEDALMKTLASKHWFRGSGENVAKFEKAYAQLTGAKGCLATANGTSALLVSLAALGVGPGDEVIVPPYTFVATVNVVLMHHAVPIFVDTDRETFQIDHRKIAAAITDRTRAIVPVHLGGGASDLDAILALAAKRKIPVVEDACQSHLGEWRGKKVGTLGATGCFSFQASKNLNSGEGGAILTNDPKLLESCYAYHNNGRGRKTDSYDFSYAMHGANLRMTEFQGALLIAQMARLEEQSRRRTENATYLTSMLREIPGILPARMYDGCTRNAYHLYMFRYDPARFAGMPRAKFLKALSAEGIPGSTGYAPLNTETYIANVLRSRAYSKLLSKKELEDWPRRTACPENDRLCNEAVWFTQNMLLGPRADMEQIAAAVRKISSYAGELAKG